MGFAVGDITGHGIQAALLMASARAVLRSHAESEFDDLGSMFADINTHLVRDTGDERFLTMFYGVIDADDRTLRWVSGGHDPALWFRYGNAADPTVGLDNDGLVLGVLEEVPYATAGPITLSPGDIIAVGTDGIWEACNPAGEDFGRDRFWQVDRRQRRKDQPRDLRRRRRRRDRPSAPAPLKPTTSHSWSSKWLSKCPMIGRRG